MKKTVDGDVKLRWVQILFSPFFTIWSMVKSKDSSNTDSFESCLARHREKAGNNKEEQRNLDILQKQYKEENEKDEKTQILGQGENKQNKETQTSGGNGSSNEYLESLKSKNATGASTTTEPTINNPVGRVPDSSAQDKERID